MIGDFENISILRVKSRCALPW